MSQPLQSQLKTGEWVLVVSNKAWFSPVYLFSLAIKAFQFLIDGRRNHQFNHAARVKDGVVIEMLGNGRNEAPVTEWLNRQNRMVAVMKPNVPFVAVPIKPYGYFDIPQLVLSWIRKKLGFGNTWNGKDGVRAKHEGFFCSEEIALALGRENAHVALPSHILDFEELELIGIIETKKQ